MINMANRKNVAAARCFGFTLLEIIVVLLIVGLLALMAGINISKMVDKGKIMQAEHDLEIISTAIERLAWDTGQWPGGQPRNTWPDIESWDLSSPNAGLLSASTNFTDWEGPYVDEIPLDPWENEYFFDPDYFILSQIKIVVGSFGPNKVGKNQYDADDIYIILKEP